MNYTFFVIIAAVCRVYCNEHPCKPCQKRLEQRVLNLTDEQYALKKMIEEEQRKDKQDLKEFNKFFLPPKPPKINEEELDKLTNGGGGSETSNPAPKQSNASSSASVAGLDPKKLARCRKVAELRQISNNMAPIAPDNAFLQFNNHPRFQRITESNDLCYYKGEVNKDGKRAGLGLVIEKPFFNITLGNFSQGWKHGFSIEVTINCKGFLQYQGYEWYQGVCRGKRMIPVAVMTILEALQQKAGCIDAHAILEKACLAIPRSKILESPEPPCSDFLEDATTYRIKLHEKMHPMFVYKAGNYDGCSIVCGSTPPMDSSQEFIARRIKKNVSSFFPRHQPCKALDVDSESGKIQAKAVQNTYDPTKKSQMWKIVKNNDESLSFANEASGHFLTVNPKGFDTYLRPMDQSDSRKFFTEQVQTPGKMAK